MHSVEVGGASRRSSGAARAPQRWFSAGSAAAFRLAVIDISAYTSPGVEVSLTIIPHSGQRDLAHGLVGRDGAVTVQ